jgi:hypothetical protein
MDVATAFLNAPIGDIDVYVRQPEGFTDPKHPDWCWHLKRSLYGLKQSGRNWNEKLTNELLELGFHQSDADPCLFTNGTSIEDTIYIAVYVDDLVHTGYPTKRKDDIIKALKTRYVFKDLGEIGKCIGITFSRDKKNKLMRLTQKEYTKEILEYFGMQDSHPTATPMEANHHLSKSMSPTTAAETDQMKNIEYSRAVGMLIYLSITTRPDIAHAVGEVSRFVANPGIKHWEAVKRILRYLNGTREYGLLFDGNSNEPPTLLGYSDADWGGNIDDRKSKTGYAIYWCGGLISWSSKYQQAVSLSTVEAEYVAACATGKEITWLRKLAVDLGFPQGTTTIMEDNTGAIALSNNPIESERTKHIDIAYHWLRNEVKEGRIELIHCSTLKMTADTLTKALVKEKFMSHRKALQVTNITPISVEGACQH